MTAAPPIVDLGRYAESILDKAVIEHPIGYRPKLEWRRYRVTAGCAFYKLGVIALSSVLITDEERLRTTLLHEYAHLMAYARFGRRGANHGPAWQAAMRELGLEPIVRHRYEAKRNAPRQEVGYRCKRCGQVLVRRRRLPKRRKYVHASCGGSLELEFVREATSANVAP